jgi:PhnB protein
MAKPIPEGYHTVTPSISVKSAAKAIEFYKKAFGAVETVRMGHGDQVMHAEIKIGDSIIMLGDESPGRATASPQTIGGTTGSIMLYVPDTDKTYKAALDAGAKSEMAPENMFWGDRFASVIDPFGHCWSIATHVEDVSEAEMKRRGEEWMSKMAAMAEKK